MDDNNNRKLEFDEFKKGLTEYGTGFSKDEMVQLFGQFDKDSSGAIDFDEFLEAVRVIAKLYSFY
jgi:Ca2+-binding EF-hand superfamily protein